MADTGQRGKEAERQRKLSYEMVQPIAPNNVAILKKPQGRSMPTR